MSLSTANVWPVLQRELREGARRPVNHRLRVFGGGVGTLVLWFACGHLDSPMVLLGQQLLYVIHYVLILLILIVVPALAADCISKEKREGTLGLLFMTPLSAGGIVTGKAVVCGLRAFTLWLAVAPILTLPFVTGGVTWANAYHTFSVEFCAILLCVAAGLLASSIAKERNAAFVLAFVLGAFFLFVFSKIGAIFPGVFFRGAAVPLTFRMYLASSAWLNPVIAIAVFLVIGWFAARQIEHSWQDKIPSRRSQSLTRRYCTPVFRNRFRQAMRQSLDRNPIAWLQQYSMKARIGKWVLCLAFLLLELAVFHSQDFVQDGANFVLCLTFAGIYTFVAVSSFLEEKRSGALELLLVTPVSPNAIIFGRVWGLWKQFLPAGLVLAGFYIQKPIFRMYMHRWDVNEFFQTEILFVFGFFALPIFATYFALRVKNLIAGAVLTWVVLWLPILAKPEAYYQTGDSLLFPVLFLYIIFAAVACFLLRHSLSRRIYSF